VAQLLVRKVEGRNWIEPRDWPDAPELPADRLADLNTKSNQLSVFVCEETDLPGATYHIAVALTANRTQLRDFDCIIVPLTTLQSADFNVVHTPKGGQSDDAEVNKRHHDIRQLTARKLLELLELMTPDADASKLPRRESVLAPVLARALLNAENEGRVKMKDELRQRVQEELSED
jgi:hypothetical protein